MFARLMGLKTLSPAELHRLIQAPGSVTVIDVNSRESWIEGHVPGARNLAPTGFTGGDLPADKSAVLVFYCSNPLCRKAPNAARHARELGYREVRVLSAGIRGWRAARLPVEADQ
jgi:rhodanese-related sulfurtransferase